MPTQGKRAAPKQSKALTSAVRPGSPKKWWLEEKTEDSSTPKVIELVNQILRQNGNTRRISLLSWYRLYSNWQAKGMLAGNYFRPQVDGTDNRLTLNLVRSAVDTMVSRITEKEPKPAFLTAGGTWADQKKAKLLDKFVSGLFYETKFAAKKAPRVLREAYIFGTGAIKGFEDGDSKVALEPTYIEELIVDDIESIYGTPRSLYQVRLYNRDVARAMFEGNDEAQTLIDNAPIANVEAGMSEWAEQSDIILIAEAWHLASGRIPKLSPEKQTELKKCREEARVAFEAEDYQTGVACLAEADKILREKHDGRHVICCETGILHFESYTKKGFPFAFTHWSEPVRGFLNGSGIAEELCTIQYEINRCLIQMAEALPFCVPKVMVPVAARIAQEWIDDLSMGIFTYEGQTPPELMTWDAIPQQLFTQLEMLVRRGYQIIGISEMAAESKKPADLESGEAIRAFDDIQTGRFFTQGRGYEELFMDTARLAIDVAKDIAERNDGSYPVNAPIRRKMVQKIDWNQINLAEDSYTMQVFPTSALPRTPAGRLAMVADLMKYGFLDKEDALRLLNFPDLDAVNEIMEAAAEFTNWQLERIIEHGERTARVMPQPYQNLKYALRHAQAAYLLSQTMGVGEDIQNTLRVYIEQCKTLDAAAMAEVPQPGIPGGPPTMPAPGEPQVAPGPMPGPGGPMPPGMGAIQ